MDGYAVGLPEGTISRAVIELGAARKGQEHAPLETSIKRAKELHDGVADICVMDGSPKRQTAASYRFAKVQTYFEMVWDHESLPDVSQPDEGWLRSYQDWDAALLTTVQNNAFSGSWDFCPNTVDQIEYRVRMPNTSQTGITLLFKGDTPAGYCWTVLNPVRSEILGLRGMVEGCPAYRGKGASRSILHAGKAYLRTLDIADI